MVAVGHSAVGTLVGINSFQFFGHSDIISGLVLTGILGWISHYITDFIPHGHFFKGAENYLKYILWVILFDLFLPIVLILATAHFRGFQVVQILYLVFAIGGAQLPDVLDGLRRIRVLPKLKLLSIENNFHMSTHWHAKYKNWILLGWKDLWQASIIGFAIISLVS